MYTFDPFNPKTRVLKSPQIRHWLMSDLRVEAGIRKIAITAVLRLSTSQSVPVNGNTLRSQFGRIELSATGMTCHPW